MTAIEKVRKYWWVFAALIALILFIVFFTSCGGNGGTLGIGEDEWHKETRQALNFAGLPNTHTQPRDHKYTSALGAIIESRVPVPQAALDKLDYGLQRTVDRFHQQAPLWTVGMSVRGTRVLFVDPNQIFQPRPEDGPPSPPCVLESIPGAPCLYINGNKSAGTVLGPSDQPDSLWDAIDADPPIILPHHAATNWRDLDYLAAAAHNENEHRIGWLNRRTEPTGIFYNFLGANDAHPQMFGNSVPYLMNRDLVVPKEVASSCLAKPTH